MSFWASRSPNAGCCVHTLLTAPLVFKGWTVRKASVLRTIPLCIWIMLRHGGGKCFGFGVKHLLLTFLAILNVIPVMDYAGFQCSGVLRFRACSPRGSQTYFPQLILSQVVLCCVSCSEKRWLDWLDFSRWRWSLCLCDVDWALSWTIMGYHN